MTRRDRKSRLARTRPAIDSDQAAGWLDGLTSEPAVTWQADGNWQGAAGMLPAPAEAVPADTTPLSAITAAADRAWDLHQGRQPVTVPPAPVAGTDRAPVAEQAAAGWKHLFQIDCAYPAAQHDTPIPCGTAHRDPAAGTFRDLRRSAQAAGWHLDAHGRWTCPRCQMSPHYSTLYPVTVWAPEWAARWSQTVAGRWGYGDIPDDAPGLDTLTIRAELRLLEDVTGSAQRGKHRAAAR